MQRIANLVVLEKCCKMRIWMQKSASMQKRTSPLKFGDLAEKSGLNSVSNLSTKVLRVVHTGDEQQVRRTTAEAFQSSHAEGAALVRGLRVDPTRDLSCKIRYRI